MALSERLSHTFTSPPLALTMRVPSLLIATLFVTKSVAPVCPLRERSNLPERLSHTFTVLS